MLLLLFRVTGEAYAVDAARVVQVVPRVELRALPHAPDALAGLFRYAGGMVPALDLGILLGSAPCPCLLSTRVIIVAERYSTPGEGLVGLIAEHVIDVRQVDDRQIIPQPSLLGPNPYIGSIVSDDNGLVPLLAVEQVFAEPIRRFVSESAP